MAQTVQSDLSSVCRGHWCVLHPGVVDEVLERRTLGRTQRKTPFDELLAFCRQEEKKKKKRVKESSLLNAKQRI